MTNLTVTVDEDLLRRARIRALQHGTSVNALLREYLEAYAGEPELKQAMDQFVELARESQAGSGSEGRTWSREDAYDR